MKEKLNNILREAQQIYYHIKNLEELENFRIKFLGRHGLLSQLSENFKNLSYEEKKDLGQYFNFVKKELIRLYSEKKELLTKREKVIFDLSHPGEKINLGRKHIINQEIELIRKIFLNLGFNVEEGREIVTEFENFDSLNIPANHPSRDLWDTFWLNKNINKNRYLLRTHTSAHQVEYLKKYGLPTKFIVIGKVYRHEATDQRHEMQFHQIEGISVGEDSNLRELKSVFEIFFENYFEKIKPKINFRTSYFPFTEPSIEIDLSCFICNKKGCNICNNSGYLEVAGAGMIHPFVLKETGLDINNFYGYAFGLGLERLIMLKYNIPDVRLFNSGDLRFLNQF